MSILSDFEDRVAGAIEGLFAGAFRSPLQPAEMARGLARAVDDGRAIGPGRVYAPTDYLVSISPEDAERMGSFAQVLEGELATFVSGHAAEKGYTLAHRPRVAIDVDDGLRMGRFRVSARLGAGMAEPDAMPDGAGEVATVTVSGLGHDVALRGDRVTVGRLGDCEIVVSDTNVSRRHAAFVSDPSGWFVEDLGSTNGTLLNGRHVKREPLRDGDVVQVGVTKLVFHAADRPAQG